MGAEGFPLIEQVSRSFPEELVGKIALPQNQGELMEPLEGAGKVFLPAPGAFHGVDLLFIALTLQLVESADEPESDPGRFRVFALSLKEAAPGMGPATDPDDLIMSTGVGLIGSVAVGLHQTFKVFAQKSVDLAVPARGWPHKVEI